MRIVLDIILGAVIMYIGMLLGQREAKKHLSEIDRCARAYGWEVGRGTPISEEITTSPGNPFLSKYWRNGF